MSTRTRARDKGKRVMRDRSEARGSVPRRLAGAAAGAVVAAALGLTVAAPAALAAKPPAKAATTPNTTVKLIEILIQNGVLTRAQADALLKQAEEEAAAAAKAAPAAGAAGAAGGAAAGAVTTTPGVAGSSVIQAPGAPAGTVRVPYVPETVRKQIKEEVKQEVVQQAKDEGWAEPNSVPDWVNRIKIFGDVRGRYEADYLDNGNGPLANYQSINSGNGLNLVTIDQPGSVPYLNTTEDRTRYQLRARLGVDARIDDWVSSQIRVATGNTDSPVSTNQTLGNDGNFSKYEIWLDRAFLQFTPLEEATAFVGRMPNPFWTTDLLFDNDLSFDGAAVQSSHSLDEDTAVFANAGGFPVFNNAFNFPSTSTDQIKSRDKYLFAGQVGAEHKINPQYKLKGAAGFYYFDNLSGKTSSPCNLTLGDDCDTDESRPQFLQKGNSMFQIRDLSATPAGNPLYQYYGLAADFGVLDLYSRFDIATYDPLHITLEANYLNNVLFDHSQIRNKQPVNNGDGSNPGLPEDDWEGGNQGFLVRATVGDERVDKLWDWNVSIAYKYLESDAVPDAFTDSDFHLGGTNAKGYILGGSLGIAKNTFLSLRWLSADEVTGPPETIDVLQLDLQASF